MRSNERLSIILIHLSFCVRRMWARWHSSRCNSRLEAWYRYELTV